jgi:hypothetical protein
MPTSTGGTWRLNTERSVRNEKRTEGRSAAMPYGRCPSTLPWHAIALARQPAARLLLLHVVTDVPRMRERVSRASLDDRETQRRGLPRTVPGSVAEGVSRHSPLPVPVPPAGEPA